MEYEIDTARMIAEIKEKKAKRVMLQLPDGLKPKAKELADQIMKETAAEVLIWAGSCYGACDTPLGIDNMKIDLLFHIGHTAWRN